MVPPGSMKYVFVLTTVYIAYASVSPFELI